MMRVLLTVHRESDAQSLALAVAARFGSAPVGIDVLTVIPHRRRKLRLRRPAPSDSSSGAHIPTELVARLRDEYGLRDVRKHVEYGDVVESIIATTTRLRSRIVLLEAPRQPGLLTAFRLDGVTRQLFQRARCPVELVRHQADLGQAPHDNVLVPMGLDEIESFTPEHFRGLPWNEGVRLHFLGVMPPAVSPTFVEANPITVLRTLRDTESARARTRQGLAQLCAVLTKAFGHTKNVDFGLVEASTHDVAVECTRRTKAGLIVLSSTGNDGGFRGRSSTLSPAAIALASPCSVMLLRQGGRESPDRNELEFGYGMGASSTMAARY